MHVSLCNLLRLHAPLRSRIDAAIARVVDSGRFVGGEEVERFEARFAALVGSAHGVAVSSGTDALLASLMALGLGPGDEVITTAFTFAAPAQAVARLGARPVFVDIDPATYALDAARVADAITERTVGIVGVHLFGQMADMDALNEVAERHGLWVVEDAAQAIGASRDGRHAGTFAATGCFSFFPTKTLGAMGDGGIVVTDSDDIAASLRQIRHHGAEPKYVHHTLGGNFRLDALQAAILDVKLDALGDWLAARAANAHFYSERFGDLAPKVGSGNAHAWHQYVLRSPARDAVRARLRACGVESAVYYPTTLDRQPCFAECGRVSGSLDHAHRAAAEVFAIPVGPELEPAECAWVAEQVTATLAEVGG